MSRLRKDSRKRGVNAQSPRSSFSCRRDTLAASGFGERRERGGKLKGKKQAQVAIAEECYPPALSKPESLATDARKAVDSPSSSSQRRKEANGAIPDATTALRMRGSVRARPLKPEHAA